jgi:hypothetical protein
VPNLFASRLRAPLPERWTAKESMTLGAPDGRANVIASTEPLDPSIGTYQYASIQGDLLRREFNDYAEIDFRPALVLGGRPGYLREFEWTPPDGDRVRQLQIYYAIADRGFTVTATTPVATFTEFEQALRMITEGIVIADTD